VIEPQIQRIEAYLWNVAGQYFSDMESIKTSLDVDIFFFKAEQLALNLRAYVLAWPTERVDVEASWPANWWEAFKERWFPRWYLKRHPIQKAFVSVHREFPVKVCPHIPLKNHRKCIEFLTTKIEVRQ
jgi:hypothetical protein